MRMVRRTVAFALLLAFSASAGWAEEAKHAGSPWPQIEADPALADQIRSSVQPFYPLGPHDLTVIPPATEPARRAAWLDERYGWWIRMAGDFARNWEQTARINATSHDPARRRRDPALDAEIKRAVNGQAERAERLAAVIPLAEAARAAVAEAEAVRVKAAGGTATEAALAQAVARRDAAEWAFFDAEREWGITGDARNKADRSWTLVSPKAVIARAQFDLDQTRRRIEDDLKAARPALSPEDFARAKAMGEEAIGRAQRLFDLRRATEEARMKANQAINGGAVVAAQSGSLAYRLVRDAVQRGRLPAAALAEEERRLGALQARAWDEREAYYEASLAVDAAQKTEQDFRATRPDTGQALARALSQARTQAATISRAQDPARRAAAQAKVEELMVAYREMQGQGVDDEVLAGWMKRVDDARAEAEGRVRQPLTPALLAPPAPPPPLRDRPPPVFPERQRPVRPAVLPVLPGPGLGVKPPAFVGRR